MVEACCGCKSGESSPAQMRDLNAVLKKHRGQSGALIPVLQEAQSIFGYLPQDAIKAISRALDKPFSEVAGVVGFYSFFSTVPRGEHVIRVCMGTACYVRGGKQVLAAVKKELGIDVGQTTEDRRFSLEVARCFGACGLAPVIMIDDTVHQRVKAAKIGELIDGYRKPARRPAKRGGKKS